jgi:DNA-binding protein H-NS
VPKQMSYADVQKQINALQAQAEALRSKEVAGVVARMKEAIATYGLTAADLGFRGTGPVAVRRGAGKRAPVAGAGVPKYRDPKSGKTWTGRGKPPLWIAGAKNRDAFLITGESARAEEASTREALSNVVKAATAGRKKASDKPMTKASAKVVTKAAAPKSAKAAKPVKAAKAPTKRAPSKAAKVASKRAKVVAMPAAAPATPEEAPQAAAA